MTCANCKAELQSEGTFCNNCGARKDAPPPPPRGGTLNDQGTVGPGSGPGGSAGRLAPGTRFADRYEIKSVIGEGSMGVVYLATDTNTGDDIVLKLVHPNIASSETAIKRLMTEGKTARQIRHPNIVAVFDVAQHDGQPYFTMEHVPGGTLRSWMVRQKQGNRDVPLPVAATIVRAILAGLGEAHRCGVVHRDLKPENVLIAGEPGAADFQVKVLDFGIARSASGGTADGGGFAGTIGYMAPEQKTAADVVGPEADFWALSVMFYELLMENPPQARWEPVSRARTDVPAAIDALLERGMSARSKSRFPSAGEYGAALDAALATPAPGPGPTPPPVRPDPPPTGESFLARLQRQWAALSTTAKAATVGGAVVLAVAANWPEPAPRPVPPPPCEPSIEDCGGTPPVTPEPEDDLRRQPPPPAADTFAAGAWRDDAGNRFTAEHDGVNVRARGAISGIGPVSITGTVTRGEGATLMVYDRQGRVIYGGRGPVVPGNGGLDINVGFFYPNNAPAGQTTIHIQH